jgi:hypothetical protein
MTRWADFVAKLKKDMPAKFRAATVEPGIWRSNAS